MVSFDLSRSQQFFIRSKVIIDLVLFVKRIVYLPDCPLFIGLIASVIGEMVLLKLSFRIGHEGMREHKLDLRKCSLHSADNTVKIEASGRLFVGQLCFIK